MRIVRIAALALLVGVAPQERTPWTSSRITGSPDPPLPFRAARAFPNLTFKKPVHLVPFPNHARYAVVEEKGAIWTFRNDPACEKPDLFIDLAATKRAGASYAIAFDPNFEKNRRCYIMYVLPSKDPNGSRVSRFRVTDDDPPRCDPQSEEILITWLAGGHNGCDLQFGNDGYLYISLGDAEDPSPPDKLRTGQDVSDLLSSVLRIDVKGQACAIPPDNPFVGREGIRPEIWCYGLRNPWRMSFDRATGRLWLGDIGWERWEMIICAERGGNYGWSVTEGLVPCIPDAKRGPTPILPPAHVLPHPEAASITGGFVYRGKRLKGFEGHYIYGDWESRRVWANPVRGASLGDRKEIARTPLRIIAFAEEADGELLILDYEKGGIHRLVPHDASTPNADFPRLLSRTGLFAGQVPAPGVIPYAINASRWADGATAQRWLAIPGRDSIQMVDKNKDWPRESVWPRDSVLAKTLSLDGRKMETQILHYDGMAWNAYSYVWNAEQTDAALAPAEGAEVGRWKVPARAACMTCHNPWPGYSLTFNAAQLHPDQIRTFQQQEILPRKLASSKPLVDPYDERLPLDERARSYLSVNCAHCHRNGGGGSARIDLRHDIKLEETRLQGVRPALGGFDLTDPFLVCGGDPSRSVLLYRTSKLGPGRMPHIGSDVVDDRGVKLLSRWIARLPGEPFRRVIDPKASLSSTTGALDLLAILETLPEATRNDAIRRALDLPPGPVRDLFERFESPRERLGTSIKPERILDLKGDAERGLSLFKSATLQCAKCHGPVTMGPDLTKIATKQTRAQLLESLLDPSKTIDPKYAGFIVQANDGEVYSGIVISTAGKELVLRDVEREVRLEVRGMVPQQKSLMPEGLLQHLTAQEASDLLAYLESLR